ncbi:hypothetical protein AMTR_s00263p00014870 [Amborella trichopoda]|uniref:Uncharacterized protein n=1 Tax=Amborella trichopoda TaxID=13333 RepID=W1P3X0_AMBTC|nr:hypothetical protein AMTR_s00263p00014870 [Amborella trichopoda]
MGDNLLNSEVKIEHNTSILHNYIQRSKAQEELDFQEVIKIVKRMLRNARSDEDIGGQNAEEIENEELNSQSRLDLGDQNAEEIENEELNSQCRVDHD